MREVRGKRKEGEMKLKPRRKRRRVWRLGRGEKKSRGKGNMWKGGSFARKEGK